MALKISEIPTTLSEITNETLVEVSEKSGTTYTTKKYNLKNIAEEIASLLPHGDEAHSETYIKEGDPVSMIIETSELKIMTADERYKLATMGGIPI